MHMLEQHKANTNTNSSRLPEVSESLNAAFTKSQIKPVLVQLVYIAEMCKPIICHEHQKLIIMGQVSRLPLPASEMNSGQAAL